MTIDPVAAAGLDAAAWTIWSVIVGWLAAHTSDAKLATDSFLTRARPFENEGRIYERLGMRRWKDWLPEGGEIFGGTSKRSVPGRSTETLRGYQRETRRAEYVHWFLPPLIVVFPLWNPWWLTAAMVLFAFVANTPCLLIQRYNRFRLLALRGRLQQEARQAVATT